MKDGPIPFTGELAVLRERTDRWAKQVISLTEVEAILRRAFPERNYSLDQLADRYGFPIHRIANLNSPDCRALLLKLEADLGVVLGTRVLKRSTFSAPRLGSINLHKGKVPEYRGMPPGFWELYDGCPSAGVTVHFVDDGLDTGDVVREAVVPIHPRDTPESLQTKLNQEGARTLAAALQDLVAGTAQRRPQSAGGGKTRTRPTFRQVRELQSKLPHWTPQPDGRTLVKNLIYLAIYHTGLFSTLRWFRRNGSRAAVLLYHRVNDTSADVLTVSTRRFAEHLLVLRKFYHPISSEELVQKLRAKERIKPTSVGIHFDDCYRDVFTEGGRILNTAGLTGTHFISSGFIGTNRVFQHDVTKSPHTFENLTQAEMIQWLELRNEIGAHTVNHVDLGEVPVAIAEAEIRQSRLDLETLTGKPIRWFSFPYGRMTNFREELRQVVQSAGYEAIFSAYGGFVGRNTPLLDVPRLGVSSDHLPLYLMMEIEGLTLSAIAASLRKFVGQTIGVCRLPVP